MDRSHWLGRLGNLNVSRLQKRGPAPHKPLMLLTVIDLFETNEIGPNVWEVVVSHFAGRPRELAA